MLRTDGTIAPGPLGDEEPRPPAVAAAPSELAAGTARAPRDEAARAAHRASWLAIRQPAVIRLLERELAGCDADALAAGLELACRLLDGTVAAADAGAAAPPRRLEPGALASGLVAVRSGRCDRRTIRALRDELEALPVVLTRDEEDAVATVLAAVACALAPSAARDAG